MTTIDITEEGHYFSAWSTKREPANDTVFFTDDWVMPFDYRYDGGMGARDYYDENNVWTYIWQPYHAFNDLIAMTGGPEKFDARLVNKPYS